MKLLVVDDEIISREGIIRNINNRDLDITEIKQADDGMHALLLASTYHPDIVLSDVRMPRMDGIEMAYKLREADPDVKIIFMSGYSEKEYLKSAIHLRALSYVEKPIDYDELEKVLAEAIHLIHIERKRREEADMQERLAKNFSLLKNEIALKLITKYQDAQPSFDYTLLGIQPDHDFVTVLIQLIQKESITNNAYFTLMEETMEQLLQLLDANGIISIPTVKDDHYILLHIACPINKRHLLKKDHIIKMFSELIPLWNNVNYFVAVGKQVCGIGNVPDSYRSAVLTLQKMFFVGFDQILFSGSYKGDSYIFLGDKIKDFRSYLIQDNKDHAITLIHDLIQELTLHSNTLASNIKNYFYRMLLQLYETSRELFVDTFLETHDYNQAWQTLTKFNTLYELETYTIEQIEAFFKYRNEKRDNLGKVLQIKNYIAANYTNSNLSVKQISEYAFISMAYMCSMFKQETGKTINQYITNLRIEKAKELLKNKSYNISEVAEHVGINDSQYFAKIFKKNVDMTPTMYKETYQNEI
ncbi:MAG: two-component response regulator, CheY-like domain protein [Herbinix sp.]|nr:two-component response regulator, CheY-like domain protein [Herbinix sp.]